MRTLFLNGCYTNEQRAAAAGLRELFTNDGELCETLDMQAFLSDTVSQIRTRSRELVRRFLQELTEQGTVPDERDGASAEGISGVARPISVIAAELGQFIRNDSYDLVLCFDPVAAFLLAKAGKRGLGDARIAYVGADGRGASRWKSLGFDRVFSSEDMAADPEAVFAALRELVRKKTQQTGRPAAPNVRSSLRHHILKMPEAVYEASGIVINGRRIKSLVFTTDLAIIRNCDADAVFAVYPFTPQQAISEAIVKAAYVPVFCGVGGGTTKGVRTVGLAKDAEAQGAMGVVLNAPISNPNLRAVAAAVDIPVVITVISEDTSIARRLESGAAIINVAAAEETPQLVRKIRSQYPALPIIASGGNTDESIRETIRAGANAVTYTPPSTKDLFRETMSKYRES